MSTSNLKHLELIKENVDRSNSLSEEEKSDSMKRIEQWYAEDQTWGTFISELSEISPKVKSILANLGLL
ncbi:MAG: hypothetical protein COB07_04200 [Sulfurovum sp.]|nr:MAG: hypothetical protein COB07_04200 [Sulfurovum sp.]